MQTTVVLLSGKLLKKRAGSCDQSIALVGKLDVFAKVKAELLTFASFLEQGDT